MHFGPYLALNKSPINICLFVLFIVLLLICYSCCLPLGENFLFSLSVVSVALSPTFCTPLRSARGRGGICIYGVPTVCEGVIMPYLIWTPSICLTKVNSEWSSDFLKVLHRRLHRGAESESEVGSQPYPMLAPPRVWIFGGWMRVEFLWEVGAQTAKRWDLREIGWSKAAFPSNDAWSWSPTLES